jgi:formyltetrahydrofolate deformylase
MSATRFPSATLLIHCDDRPGIVAAVTEFLSTHNGNIVHLDQHVDDEQNVFFMRVQWDMREFDLPDDASIRARFEPIATRFAMRYQLRFSEQRKRMAIFVSKQSHCLYDLLARWQSQELIVDIPLIISNHDRLQSVAAQFGIPFQVFNVSKETKASIEQQQLDLLAEHAVDFVVLARYMQILTDDFVGALPNRIINIHHSFLPAFVGARPYHQAFKRGVKIIGATSHYVTAELDAGPIIAQDVTQVSHKDSVKSMIRRGKDLEKTVLARAVWHHVQDRVLVYANKTVVFD